MEQNSVWNQLTTLPFLGLYTNLLNTSMELDVFSPLSTPMTAEALAEARGWDKANTRYMLSALVSVGFLKKEGETYQNTPDADRYLVKGKPEYLGGFLLFYGMNEGGVPMDMKKLVAEGPQQPQQMEQALDFEQYGKALREAQLGYRQQEMLGIVRTLPENKTIRCVLDVGCATGLLGLAVIGDEAGRTGVLFDQLPPALIQASVEETGLGARVEVKNGNFLTDDLGSGYDLILGIGIMLFAKGQMAPLLKKFYDALNPGGVLLLVGEGIEPDQTGPWDMVMGYLPYYLQGMDMGVVRDEIVDAAKTVGFTQFEKRTELLCSGTQDIDILRK